MLVILCKNTTINQKMLLKAKDGLKNVSKLDIFHLKVERIGFLSTWDTWMIISLIMKLKFPPFQTEIRAVNHWPLIFVHDSFAIFGSIRAEDMQINFYFMAIYEKTNPPRRPPAAPVRRASSPARSAAFSVSGQTHSVHCTCGMKWN